MKDFLSPNTSIALMQASNGDLAAQTKKLGTAKTAGLKTPNAENIADNKEVRGATETAQEFEAVFIAEMMKPMFEGISTEAPFGGGKGEEVFRGLLLQEYGKLMAQTGSIGLSSQVRDQIIQMQSAADHNKTTLNPQDVTEMPDE